MSPLGPDRRVPSRPRPRRAAAGFTLLEVLVAMGIVVAALAGIAALLPAAGSRLADATETDRAGIMAANAWADMANRGLLTSALWSGTVPAVVFGEGLPALATPANATAVGPAVTAEVGRRIDLADGFLLRDDVRSADSAVVAGFERKICFGCMLSLLEPVQATPTPGTRVRATTVVFRTPNPPTREFTLTQTGSGSTVFTSGTGSGADADRRRFLAGCSWVVAIRSGTAPLCVPIASSWTTYLPGATTGGPTGTAHVSLSGTDVLGYVSGSTVRVVGFDGLLRVDERIEALE